MRLKRVSEVFQNLRAYPAILLFLILGSFLRLSFLEDMEWKGDEKYLFESSVNFKTTHEFPWVGMPSSKGIRNPGLSVWLFLALGSFSNEPIGLARGVAVLNIIALWAALLFILRCVKEEERSVWLWGLALFAVSANPVLYSRKIWQQCVLVPFLWLFFLGFYYRHKRAGALLCGAMGMMLGQIHMSGFIFVPICLVGAFGFSQKNATARSALLLGLVLGSLPLLPWLFTVGTVRTDSLAGHSIREPLSEIFRLKFWFRWFDDALGLTLRYHLREQFWSEFIKEPIVRGYPTYGVGLLYLGSLALWVSGLVHFVKAKVFLKPHRLKKIFLVCGVFYGGLLTLLGLRIYPHYLITIYPVIHLSVSWMMNGTKQLRLGFVVCQALITILFLAYIHRTGGNPDNEYGMTYSQQQLNLERKL